MSGAIAWEVWRQNVDQLTGAGTLSAVDFQARPRQAFQRQSVPRQIGAIGLRLSVAGAAIGMGWALAAPSAYAGDMAAAETAQPVEQRLAAKESFGALMEPVAEGSELAEFNSAEPRILRTGTRLQCVPYARAESGVDIRGDAKNWWTLAAGRYLRTQEPAAGNVFVMNGYAGANRGHVAVVRRIVSSRKIVVDHANWLNQGEITVDVPVKDVSSKGDWSAVRVWHVPTQTWGKRVYTARGFIAPSPIQQASVSISFAPTS
jgi:surface antigen